MSAFLDLEGIVEVTGEQLADAIGIANEFPAEDLRKHPPAIYAALVIAGSINRLAEVQAVLQPEILSLMESIDITLSEIAGALAVVRKAEPAGAPAASEGV